MTNSELWAGIVAFLLPLLAAALLRQAWSDGQKAAAAFAICVAAAFGTNYFTGQIDFTALDANKIITTVLIVFNGAIVAYLGFWKPTGIAPKLQKWTG